MTIPMLAPSDLDYGIDKCPRCFYLKKKFNISTHSYPPPVFSNFDVVQQRYFKNKNVSELAYELPSGKIMGPDELPGRIVSDVLKDNKQRPFKLGGRPDIVIEFDDPNQGYGIIDFKTTNIDPLKSEKYKFQLEAYAQIFTHPGETIKSKTPKLGPIYEMGVLQFFPQEIFAHERNQCDLEMRMSYSPWRRNPQEFYDHITKILDLLLEDDLPRFTSDCGECNFYMKQQDIINELSN